MSLKQIAIISCLLLGVLKAESQVNIAINRACYQSGAADYNNTAHLVTDGQASTYWMSRNTDSEWLYVDLGFAANFSALKINWGESFAKEYIIDISTEGPNSKPEGWKNIYSQSNGDGNIDEINISAKARYIRITCQRRSGNEGFIIKELEVIGKKRIAINQLPAPSLLPDGRKYLTGGNWKLQRQSFVNANGEDISKSGYADAEWIPASVPGTILSSYFNIGAIPDQNYADQQLMISDEFFTANFWYRNTFDIPDSYNGKEVWINFDGINWKADVFFNGNKIGRIEGAYTRARFNITNYTIPGKPNALAVLIYKNDNPGDVTEQHLNDPDGNGGIIGLDSPTILASIGWNWIPTIRGRNCGIWNDVFLSTSNAVSIIDPFIKTNLDLPDTSIAHISLEFTLKNIENRPVNGVVKGKIGSISFEQTISLKAEETRVFSFTPTLFPQLTISHPSLWWPNGYGNQNLHKLNLQFVENNIISDQKEVTFGIREYSYSIDDNNLTVNINGYPLIVRGGNWGMAEAMMRCDSAGYDLRVRLHKEMNLNMIRNWIGMIGDDEFYEACDKYGIMIWDDFWLANPVDGPHPSNNSMFMANVRDKIALRRNHASLALWCGRNEGYPPAYLDSAMYETVSDMDGSRFYVSSSAHRPVTGLGPYETKDPVWYFTQRGTTFHSEQGIVCVPSEESLREMMPEENLWPINDMWGKHDWTQPRVKIYTDDITRSYGEASGIGDFCRKAQMMNMEGPKAMIETWQSNRGPGVIVWMTHSAWPSLICQTYDYFFEPTAAYFAFKNASEPLHILWRTDNNKIQVSNNTLINRGLMNESIEVYNLSGQLIYNETIKKEIPSNTTVDIQTLKLPSSISGVYFIKLQLSDNSNKILSRNFYWSSTNYQDYKALDSMPKVEITGNATVVEQEKKSIVTATLHNTSNLTALMIRLKLQQSKSGKRILPAFYSDNYISLAPNEKRTVTIEFDNKLLNNEKAQLLIEGWNISPNEITITK